MSLLQSLQCPFFSLSSYRTPSLTHPTCSVCSCIIPLSVPSNRIMHHTCCCILSDSAKCAHANAEDCSTAPMGASYTSSSVTKVTVGCKFWLANTTKSCTKKNSIQLVSLLKEKPMLPKSLVSCFEVLYTNSECINPISIICIMSTQKQTEKIVFNTQIQRIKIIHYIVSKKNNSFVWQRAQYRCCQLDWLPGIIPVLVPLFSAAYSLTTITDIKIWRIKVPEMIFKIPESKPYTTVTMFEEEGRQEIKHQVGSKRGRIFHMALVKSTLLRSRIDTQSWLVLLDDQGQKVVGKNTEVGKGSKWSGIRRRVARDGNSVLSVLLDDEGLLKERRMRVASGQENVRGSKFNKGSSNRLGTWLIERVGGQLAGCNHVGILLWSRLRM
ncbi:hypothetical protein VP01_483g1 [Puccinia sorghi]|uniref:Uncharacterized protein n=1 Tax=Puccinia sorghi TaxID=27349 RepID=A0A0L6UPC2_9BASI|nr:hypothetical protein VP01_483g1 [Puccinia sorghi]